MAKARKALTYETAGVDVHTADALVDYLQKRSPVIGGFSGLYPITVGGQRIHLVGCTDGVGTKLKLAFMMDRHDTVGIDLVAMCVNDLVCCGATPLFFLDYYATAKLDLPRSKKLMDGILEGCRQGHLTLLGGETAEMPGFYTPGEYDLAGFSVGMVHDDDVLDGSRVRAGDLLCALPSSGVHSNGFSLIRRALGPALLKKHGKTLLTPTRIYVDDVAALRRACTRGLKALAHITGEGLPGNVPRVLPPGFTAVLDRARVKTPKIFSVIQKAGGLSDDEMWRTFNMGAGMVVVLDEKVLSRARSVCPDLMVVGAVKRGRTPFVFGEAA